MFWGRERKEILHQKIFGDPKGIAPDSKTLINALYNMITLGSDAHRSWSRGIFLLEPLEQFSPYELRLVVQYMPPRSKGPSEIEMDSDPASIGLTPIPNEELFVNFSDFSPIKDGHIVTIRTSDPSKAPLPDPGLLMLQSFLIRVLRMAGRAGNDMLETFDTDDEVSSIAASESGPSGWDTTATTTHQNSSYENHNRKKQSLVVISTNQQGPVTKMTQLLKQPPQKRPSVTHKIWSRVRTLFRTGNSVGKSLEPSH